MQSYLTTLTAFNNRYYKSTTGQQSAQWIFNTLTGIASGKQGVTVTKFSHSWVQFSVIARIAGTTSGPVTILGAHQDSINLNSPTSGRAPGADDVGFVSRSHFITVIETSFRRLGWLWYRQCHGNLPCLGHLWFQTHHPNRDSLLFRRGSRPSWFPGHCCQLQ